MIYLALAQTIFYLKNNSSKYFMKIFIGILSIIIISMLIFTIDNIIFINIYIIILPLALSFLQIFACEQGLLTVENEIFIKSKAKIFFKVLIFNILSAIIMILFSILFWEIFKEIIYNSSVLLSHLFYSEISIFFPSKDILNFFSGIIGTIVFIYFGIFENFYIMNLFSPKRFKNQSPLRITLNITSKFLSKKVLIFIFGFVMLDIIIKDPISTNIENVFKFYQQTFFYDFPIEKIILITILRNSSLILGLIMLFVLNYGFIVFLASYYKVATLSYESEIISSNEIEKYQRENLISEVSQDNKLDRMDREDKNDESEINL